YFFCSNVGDVPRPKTQELQGTEGKDKLVAAVKASFDFCTTALAKADDSKLNDNITWFDGKPRARAWAFVALASSWADHYGIAALLALIGIVFLVPRVSGAVVAARISALAWSGLGIIVRVVIVFSLYQASVREIFETQ